MKNFLERYMPLFIVIWNLVMLWWTFPIAGLITVAMSLLGARYTNCRLKKTTLVLSIIACILCIANWNLELGMWIRYEAFN